MTTPVTSTAAPAAATAAPDQAKLKKAAQAFEAVFLRQMIGSMRTSSLGDGLLDSSASQQFRDMSDARLADTMAQKGALHIADMLVKQFGARVAPAATATIASLPTVTPGLTRGQAASATPLEGSPMPDQGPQQSSTLLGAQVRHDNTEGEAR